MKKITAVISALAAAAVITVSTSAANIPLERLSGSLSDIRNDELVITAALNIGSAHVSAILKYFAEDYPNTDPFVQE